MKIESSWKLLVTDKPPYFKFLEEDGSSAETLKNVKYNITEHLPASAKMLV